MANDIEVKATNTNTALRIMAPTEMLEPLYFHDLRPDAIRLTVRFGSLANIRAAKSRVRFAPNSGHVQRNS